MADNTGWDYSAARPGRQNAAVLGRRIELCGNHVYEGAGWLVILGLLRAWPPATITCRA
jgi:hypothetical protein